ncbi:hypothetical protein E8E15_003152 [Penicillium rubens]|uniref:Pc18g01500 protein n=2 Tax=Penicillium chrysogenum species complex TaxID=254878 RepID=B6HCF0_PENRW|nr:uncharacterized protein N7525_000828 [Penicillium rubens]KZN91894.1 UPF0592 membrane protein [Penicillium chrysogenum]CAP94374.1 Pc18g01500 [Penicillium rubens Wisconsin 54-1255]KAF3022698.1 hypothetical protein E8E15_003152 [Penicillium rubens]KAJ5039460.1 hypothetical protein NUH16_009242 [Penicillium rubens]KAJ5843087.1 hypothetical protein N7525_000828 [Penicillium rubens]
MSPPSPETNDDQNPELSRAASYTDLPSQTATESSLRRTFSDYAVPTLAESPTKETVAAGKDILRRTSLRSKDKSKQASVSQFTLSSSEDLKDTDSFVPETRAPEPAARPSKSRSMSGRIVSLARKPWGSSSRSPSPSAKRSKQQDSQSPSRSTGRKTEDDQIQPSRRRTILYKRPRRPMLAVVAKGPEDSPGSPSSPSGNSLRHRSSFEKFTASLSVSTPVLPPMPKGAAETAAAYANAGTHHARKKDELWGIFRGLEADFQKFQAKSSSLKANVIRTSLLPFLSRHHLHASCKNLRPEDLDRRVNILNKWWIGMLEMLNGKNNQSISGTDRPVFLEAVVGIMARPEWRIPFPMAQNGSGPTESLKYASTSVSETSDGSGSSGSDFLVESIHHNIRNIFIQNLLSQMAFVVERMSMRHAPASLVAFCGKVCAYAFFFCPGVSETLVRLWSTPPNMYRRILSESAESRTGNMRVYTQELAACFPPALRPLAFHSQAPLLRYLRQKPELPLNTTSINWNRPWIARWAGRDTDLFYVFVKYIHILYAEYLPPGTEKAKRILAPGLLMVHAQVLLVLEDTIYKQSAQQGSDNPHTAAAITFDDFIESPDASASTQHLRSGSNTHRSMAENRLIILLRDLLSESSVEPNRARLLFAESFCGIIKAAAQKMSLFDHNACFLLCDFLEEVIPIVTRYAQSIETELFDWGFWLDVCRQMMQSHNSLTEVRVFSFLFCIWGTWTATEERKASICLDFLLHEPVFYHYFNHWSPMVRAYFHRLLCWRVGRFNTEPSSLDSNVYEILSDRLLRVWEYYIGFQSKAEEGMTAPLSSAPCTPAPGRRIIIIRCENQLSPANLFVSFDRVVPPVPSDQLTSHRRTGSSDSNGSDGQPSKRRWGILKAMFGSSSNTRSGDGISSSSSDDSENAVSDSTMTADTKCMDDHEQTAINGMDEIIRPKAPHQPFFFKFSLEWMDRPQWPTKNKRLFTPCLPVASQLHVEHRRSPDKSDYDTASENLGQSDFENDEQQPDSLTNDQDTPTQPTSDTWPRTPTTKNSPLPELPSQPSYDHLVSSKYAGRALAEWAHIVSECDSFFARRRDEGVPSDRMVETPTLGVESFRK